MTENMENELYYIWNRNYSGNAMVWWRTNDEGYTANIKNAQTYTLDEALKRIGTRGHLAFPCSMVQEAIIQVVHADLLDRSKGISNKKAQSV